MTIGALDVINNVWPSGAALTTRSEPMLPPAPPRLSTMHGLASSSCKPLAIGRAAISEGPPAGHGPMIVTCFDGYDCAEAAADSIDSAAAPRMRFIQPRPLVIALSSLTERSVTIPPFPLAWKVRRAFEYDGRR